MTRMLKEITIKSQLFSGVLKFALMAVLEFKDAQPQTKAKLQIKSDEETVREVELPFLRGEDTAPDSGKRYISIVNGDATKLKAGKYRATIVLNDDRIAKSETFTVK